MDIMDTFKDMRQNYITAIFKVEKSRSVVKTKSGGSET